MNGLENKYVLFKEGKNFFRIILNNPSGGNRLNLTTLKLINDYIDKALSSSSCLSIIIENTENVFSLGMDFRYLSKLANNQKDSNIGSDFTNSFKNLLLKIRNSSKPVISVVNGKVLAGGIGIIAASDIVIATESSTFGLSEALFGLIPAIIYPFLLERISFKKARFLALTSVEIDSSKAYDNGLIDEICKKNKMKIVLRKYLQKISYSSCRALKLIKEYSDNLTKNEYLRSVDLGSNTSLELLNDSRILEGIASFNRNGLMPYMPQKILDRVS